MPNKRTVFFNPSHIFYIPNKFLSLSLLVSKIVKTDGVAMSIVSLFTHVMPFHFPYRPNWQYQTPVQRWWRGSDIEMGHPGVQESLHGSSTWGHSSVHRCYRFARWHKSHRHFLFSPKTSPRPSSEPSALSCWKIGFESNSNLSKILRFTAFFQDIKYKAHYKNVHGFEKKSPKVKVHTDSQN